MIYVTFSFVALLNWLVSNVATSELRTAFFLLLCGNRQSCESIENIYFRQPRVIHNSAILSPVHFLSIWIGSTASINISFFYF